MRYGENEAEVEYGDLVETVTDLKTPGGSLIPEGTSGRVIEYIPEGDRVQVRYQVKGRRLYFRTRPEDLLPVGGRTPDGELDAAVREDHPTRGCDNACSIASALRFGTPRVAAWLLQQATETPAIDRTLREHKDVIRSTPDGWEGWSRFTEEHGRECPGCGSVVYPDDPGDPDPEPPRTCGNCRTSLRPCDGTETR